MSDAGQEAARRWPQAVNSRNESTYPTAALYEFSRAAFVAGAEWQQQKQDDVIRESGALAMAESTGADIPQPLVALLTTVDVLSKRWVAMTVRVIELQAMGVQLVDAEERADAVGAKLGRIRALVAGELGAAGSVQAVRAIREILGELPGRVATCSHDGGIWPGMSTCADCGAEVEIVTPGDPS